MHNMYILQSLSFRKLSGNYPEIGFFRAAFRVNAARYLLFRRSFSIFRQRLICARRIRSLASGLSRRFTVATGRPTEKLLISSMYYRLRAVAAVLSEAG